MTREIPIIAPRPVTLSLPLACKAAVEAGTQLQEMNLSRWAQSFNCFESDVIEAFEKAQWIATQRPTDDEGDFAK